MVSPDLIVIKRWTWKQFTVLIIAAVLLLTLFLLMGFWLGHHDGIILRAEKKQLINTVNELTQQFEDSQRQLVMQKQISKVDQAANIHAGNSMDSQHQQIRELERELKFFRNIMAPEESLKGLQISRFTWQKQKTNIINWQLSLIQAGSQGLAVSGFANMELIALKDEKEVLVPLLTEDKKERFNYRFKYFQHITGSLVIEAGLVPVSIKITAHSKLKGQPSIEKRFPWQSDEEKIANVE
ncbi:MAG: hypothetical protein GY829_14680 [Gammaproteobacteria bacterium]|nr:hypothetical protein [Gammaproteobacteria bacterium]